MERFVRRHSGVAHRLVLCLGNIGRTDLLCRARLVLCFVVVKTAFGDYLYRRQGFAAEQTDRELSADNILLNHDLGLAVAKRVLYRLSVLIGRMYYGDPHAGTARAGFYNAGEDVPLERVFFIVKDLSARGEDFVLDKHAFG